METIENFVAADQYDGDRPYQEDDYGLSQISIDGDDASSHTLLVLADGMGGHVGGKEASRIAVHTFVEEFQGADGTIPDHLRQGLDLANAAIADKTQASPELDGMGCTLVGVSVSGQGVHWISVGDSPLWLWDQSKLTRLNEDHSMAPVLEELVALGRMTAEEAKTDSGRHTLRSAVMGDELEMVDLPSTPLPIKKGDVLLVASDGIETLEEDVIADIIAKHRTDPKKIISTLLKKVEAEKQPYQDNTTAIAFVAPDDFGAVTPTGSATTTQKLGDDAPDIIPATRVVREDGANDAPAKSGRGLTGLLAVLLLVALAVIAWLVVMPDSGDGEPDPVTEISPAVDGQDGAPMTPNAPVEPDMPDEMTDPTEPTNDQPADAAPQGDTAIAPDQKGDGFKGDAPQMPAPGSPADDPATDGDASPQKGEAPEAAPAKPDRSAGQDDGAPSSSSAPSSSTAPSAAPSANDGVMPDAPDDGVQQMDSPDDAPQMDIIMPDAGQ